MIAKLIDQICTNKDELVYTMINRIVDFGNHVTELDSKGAIFASDSAKWAATLTPSAITNLEFVVLKVVCVELGLFITGPQMEMARYRIAEEQIDRLLENIMGPEGGLSN